MTQVMLYSFIVFACSIFILAISAGEIGKTHTHKAEPGQHGEGFNAILLSSKLYWVHEFFEVAN